LRLAKLSDVSIGPWCEEKSADFLTKIVIAPVIINQSELNLQQTLLYKSFTHLSNFVTLTVFLFEKIGLL